MKSNVNKLTPGHNVFWESSRIILQQHRDLTLAHERLATRRQRPELTEEEREEMFGKLAASRANTIGVTITVFEEFGEDRIISGIVAGLDPRQKLVKVEVGDDWEFVKFADIVRVDIEYDYVD